MWVHLIVRYRDTARSFCGNCKINWKVLAQGREPNLQMEEINFLSFGPSLPIHIQLQNKHKYEGKWKYKTTTNINGRDQLSQYRAKFTDTQYGPTISKGKTWTSFLLEWGEFPWKCLRITMDSDRMKRSDDPEKDLFFCVKGCVREALKKTV